MKFALTFLLCFVIFGCVKDSQYTFSNTYNLESNSVKISLQSTLLAANGSAKDTITLAVLNTDLVDSVNVSALTFTITTSAGSFLENGLQTISIAPSYKLDSSGTKRILRAQVTLQSSAKVETSNLIIKYLSIQKDTSVNFYRVFPDKLTLSASSLSISPNFQTEDTIFAKLSSSKGTPSAGDNIIIKGYDSLFNKSYGIFRVSNNLSDVFGRAYFIYVLGDSTINVTNYRGKINLVASAADSSISPLTDTISIYSH